MTAATHLLLLLSLRPSVVVWRQARLSRTNNADTNGLRCELGSSVPTELLGEESSQEGEALKPGSIAGTSRGGDLAAIPRGQLG